MPKYQISWKADLTNISTLEVGNKEEFEWKFAVKCTKCQEQHEPVSFAMVDKNELPNSRSVNNLVMKCKFCSSVGTIDVVPNSIHSMNNEGTFQPLVVIEGRGWEPLQWIPEGGFKVTAESGTVFEDVLLDEDWVDYDEASSEPVEVMELVSEITKAK